ncbi:MAG: ribose 5-phosphate isomerase B [Nanoarchaeota archaeon]
MKLIIGSDHAGLELKEKIKETFSEHEFDDVGTYTKDSVDYPDYAKKVAEKVAAGEGKGILICMTGIGMCITANRNPKVRAALVYSEETARLTRDHNDSNIICLGAATMDNDLALKMVKIWIETPFSENERHTRRNAKMS